MLTRAEMLTNMEELIFTCLDMRLYLDAHAEDEKAIAAYNNLCSDIAKKVIDYEKKYGVKENSFNTNNSKKL